MDQLLKDISSLVGEDTVIFGTPFPVTANNSSHFLTKVSKNEFWWANGINGAPDLLNQVNHSLRVLDQYHLEIILGILQVQHEVTR